MIKSQIDYAIKMWQEAREIDQPRGHLIYCYVGSESKLDNIKDMVRGFLQKGLNEHNFDWGLGAPIVVILLHDADGYLGQRVAEYWVLADQMNDEEKARFHNFILEKSSNIKLDMENCVSRLEKERHVLVATAKPIQPARISSMLYQIFDIIYYERTPFPFDGFSTARGNAAKDCQTFTRQFFRGLLDRNWLMTQAAQQKNRGEKVLDKAWGIFDQDGSLRHMPREESLRKIVEIFECSLRPNEDDSGSLNLGDAMRLLCAPPYGFNIASAGLVLAIFVGKRRNGINLLRDQQLVSIEAWLPDVLQGNFLNLGILDKTDIVTVSQETVSEWERLLEDWDTENTYSGKVIFHKKALEMEETVPIPQSLYYKFENLADKARGARAKINNYEKTLDDAINKIYEGGERDNFVRLTWGASILVGQLSAMEMEDTKWTPAQTNIVQENLASARLKTQQMFPSWYTRQTVHSIENLGGFKRKMSSVGRNLASLGLDEEQDLLAAHVEEIEGNVRLIEELKQIITNIRQMVNNSVVNDSTTIETLNSWLEQVQVFARGLEEARRKTIVVERDIRDAKILLGQFQRDCRDQVERNKERLVKIYNIEEIKNQGEISNWKQEVTQLIKIFGNDTDGEYLFLVQKQLDLLEKHFNMLDDTELDDQCFQRLLQQCEQEIRMSFDSDDPPLDSEAIYASICNALKAKRSGLATIWMENYLPPLNSIKKFDADKALQTISSLQKRPKFLSPSQLKEVRGIITACKIRIDELEVDGLLAMFQGMSEQNKRVFLEKIESDIRAYISNIAKGAANWGEFCEY